MTLSIVEIALVAGTGFAAGTLGGLLGIGGSVIMIPALVIVFPGRGPDAQHLFQAAAMAANVAVALPAAIRHSKSGALRVDILKWLLPAGLIAIMLGVWLSNNLNGITLRRIYAAFLLYLAIQTIVKIFRKQPDPSTEESKATPVRVGAVGSVLGATAGLLGIGGGILAVPLLQTLCRVPLKQAIAASSATMCVTAAIGATGKISTLPQHGQFPADALLLALALAPTAMVGGWFGASLTQRAPLELIRFVLTVLLLLGAWRMSGL